MARRIDDCLSIADGRLQIEACDAAELAERFGTPLSVISEDQLRRNARRFKRALAAAWPEGEARVLPSIKANYTLALRCALAWHIFFRSLARASSASPLRGQSAPSSLARPPSLP